MWNASLVDGPIPILIYGSPVPDPEGGTYTPIIGYEPGYHLNIAPYLITPQIAPFAVDPTDPARVFMGGQTGFLKFADEAGVRAYLGAYWIEE